MVDIDMLMSVIKPTSLELRYYMQRLRKQWLSGKISIMAVWKQIDFGLVENFMFVA
jgi:hypothetical protein